MEITQRMVERNQILRVGAGSQVLGISLDGVADRDELGICLEELEWTQGFTEFEQYIYRSATERTGKPDEPSQPGDLDLTIYGLRKFLRLAMQGNPAIVQMLFQKEHIHSTAIGKNLQDDLTPYIISKKAASRFLGYMESQKQRLVGERGQKKVNRPELEEKFGYDTKYAMHILRLGMQGVELLTTGTLEVPFREKDRTYLLNVRTGKVPMQEVLTRAGELERELKDLRDTSPLRDEPDRDYIEKWMIERYFAHWRSTYGLRYDASFLSDTRNKMG